jgi:hypothetical protein
MCQVHRVPYLPAGFRAKTTGRIRMKQGTVSEICGSHNYEYSCCGLLGYHIVLWFSRPQP